MITSPKHLPRYLKFAQQLQALISAGEYAPGDQLPSQRQLAEQFGVTLMTIRKGLDILAEEGGIRIEHGVGTFVNSLDLTADDFQLLSFNHDLRQRPVGELLTQVVDVQPSMQHAAATRGLKLAQGDPVARLSRVRFLDSVPIVFQQSFLPSRLHHVIEVYQPRSSLYSLLREALGQPVTMAKEVIVPIALSAEHASVLQALAGDPAWRSIRISTTADGTPVLYDEAILRQDHFVITIEHRGQRATCQLSMLDGKSPDIFDYLMEE